MLQVGDNSLQRVLNRDKNRDHQDKQGSDLSLPSLGLKGSHMANVPSPSRFAAGELTQERPVVELRVDLILVLDRRSNVVEWKLQGWATKPAEISALAELQRVMTRRHGFDTVDELQPFIQLLTEYCEPF